MQLKHLGKRNRLGLTVYCLLFKAKQPAVVFSSILIAGERPENFQNNSSVFDNIA